MHRCETLTQEHSIADWTPLGAPPLLVGVAGGNKTGRTRSVCVVRKLACHVVHFLSATIDAVDDNGWHLVGPDVVPARATVAGCDKVRRERRQMREARQGAGQTAAKVGASAGVPFRRPAVSATLHARRVDVILNTVLDGAQHKSDPCAKAALDEHEAAESKVDGRKPAHSNT